MVNHVSSLTDKNGKPLYSFELREQLQIYKGKQLNKVKVLLNVYGKR